MKLNVLFIGNSHTYLHYMPQMLAHLVKASGRGIEPEFDQSVGEGVSLAWHWNHEPTRDKMHRKRWDYVVLQDRSGGPLEELESFRKHARLLDAEIKGQGAKTIFYLTWAHRDRPDNQALLTDAYRGLARELDAVLAPVGLAWAAVRNVSSEPVLHHPDGRHANPAGAYLTACVFYAVLLKTSPEGLPAGFFIEGKTRPDQDEAQGLMLQKVAWETVLNSEIKGAHSSKLKGGSSKLKGGSSKGKGGSSKGKGRSSKLTAHSLQIGP
jgi:hypothetical protein